MASSPCSTDAPRSMTSLQKPPAASQPSSSQRKTILRSDYVAAKNKWNLDGEWFRKGESHYRYLSDVDDLVNNHGAILNQAIALAPNIPYILVAGTPCQDLTLIGKLVSRKEHLDWPGQEAYTFTPFTLHCTSSRAPQTSSTSWRTRPRPEYKQAIQLSFGNLGRRPQLRTRDSAQHTPAQRRRYYFTNSQHTAEPPQDANPWSEQWTSIYQLARAANHKLLPIVRQQGHDRKGPLPPLTPRPAPHSLYSTPTDPATRVPTQRRQKRRTPRTWLLAAAPPPAHCRHLL